MSRAPARDYPTWRSARGELGRFCGTDGRFRDTPASLSGGRALAQQFPNHREQLARFERLDQDRKSTRLNSSHLVISYAVFCLKKKKKAETKYQRSTSIAPYRT